MSKTWVSVDGSPYCGLPEQRVTDLALADPSSLSEKYILRGDETFAVLSRLVAHGKQLFLITNSPFSFV